MDYVDCSLEEALDQIIKVSMQRREFFAGMRAALLEDDSKKLKYYVQKYIGLVDVEGHRIY